MESSFQKAAELTEHPVPGQAVPALYTRTGGLGLYLKLIQLPNFLFSVFFSFFFFVLFCFLSFSFRASPAAYGGSQARGPIGAIAARLHHSLGNARSEPHLRPTPQLMSALDP